MPLPLTNTESELKRYEEVKTEADRCKGAFVGEVKKFPRYGEYSFEATWNPEFQKTEVYKTLSSADVLALVYGDPWYFGGKIKNRTSTKVWGVIYD